MYKKLISIIICVCIVFAVLPAVTPAAQAANETYYSTVAAAGADLREQLKARQTTAVVRYQIAGGYENVSSDIFEEALRHTGEPTEGDYLRYQYSGYRCSISYYTSGGVCYITLTYTVSYHTTAAQEEAVDAAVEQLRGELGLDELEGYDSFMAIYDWMAANITYDYDNLNDDSYTLKYTPYAALINKTSVCQGYATLLYRLLLTEGIDNRIISGTANKGAHAWNIVEMDEEYYNVDITWDAIYSQSGFDYEHCLRCDDEFPDHTRYSEYTTSAFVKAYPMAEESYVPSQSGNVKLAIKTQPSTQKVKAGNTASFKVSASGTGLSYQWQTKTSSSGSWKNCTFDGSKTASVSVPATTARTGYYYRCKITDGNGNVVYTNTVRLYVLGVKTQPTTQKVKAGATAKFTVSATGANKTYQWQTKTSSSGSWKNCTFTGSKTATLSVPATTARNGYYYRCKITDDAGNVVYTSTVRLYVLGVKTQPANKTVKKGSSAKFTVSATGSGLTYQWQTKTSSKGSWKNCSFTGSKTASMSVPATSGRNGYYYRCKITDSAGNVIYTNTVKLTVK